MAATPNQGDETINYDSWRSLAVHRVLTARMRSSPGTRTFLKWPNPMRRNCLTSWASTWCMRLRCFASPTARCNKFGRQARGRDYRNTTAERMDRSVQHPCTQSDRILQGKATMRLRSTNICRRLAISSTSGSSTTASCRNQRADPHLTANRNLEAEDKAPNGNDWRHTYDAIEKEISRLHANLNDEWRPRCKFLPNPTIAA